MIKVGTSSLIRAEAGTLNLTSLAAIVEMVRDLKAQGFNVIIVSRCAAAAAAGASAPHGSCPHAALHAPAVLPVACACGGAAGACGCLPARAAACATAGGMQLPFAGAAATLGAAAGWSDRRPEADARCPLRARALPPTPLAARSGAVGVGCQRLKLATRPDSLAQKQALAAVGQVHLMRYYDDLFSALDLVRVLPCLPAGSRCCRRLLRLARCARRACFLAPHPQPPRPALSCSALLWYTRRSARRCC